METIKCNVNIPEDHRLRLDIALPADLPVGNAEVVLVVSTHAATPGVGDIRGFAGILSDSPIFSRDPVSTQEKLRDEWN